MSPFALRRGRWTPHDRDGTARERVTWLTCALFGEARVRALAPRITKGARLTVCGALRGNTYEVDGVKHEGLQLIVDGIELPPLDRDDARDDDARDNPAQDAPRDQRAQGHRAARGGRR